MKLRSLSDLRSLRPEENKSAAIQPEHDKKGKRIRVFLDTKGRKGKTVTIISGLQQNHATMEEISRMLKQHCGAGGSVKEGKIEIQGDQRERVTQRLRLLNYYVV